MGSSLTAENFDWLRKLQAAAAAKRDPPSVPMSIAAKLGEFGFVETNSLDGFAVTAKGREALLDQNMRDAEDRWMAATAYAAGGLSCREREKAAAGLARLGRRAPRLHACV